MEIVWVDRWSVGFLLCAGKREGEGKGRVREGVNTQESTQNIPAYGGRSGFCCAGFNSNKE